MRYVLIMAGGSGKRLWPLSRQGMPKQLLKIVGGTSLLRIAYERVVGLVAPENVLVCTGADYAEVVAAELPEIDPANILGEPEGRDSLNAIAWPAAILAARDPEAVMAVLASDHIMRPEEKFRQALDDGFALAEADDEALVTFGVVPTSAHTGYGYLHRGAPVVQHAGAYVVQAFKEKPDAVTAQHYVASGDYWWNSGMFVWRARTFLDQVRHLLPDTHTAVSTLAAAPERLGEIYPTLIKISVDYAVLEPTSLGHTAAHVVALPLPITWHDVGGYGSLLQQYLRDENGNAVSGTHVLLDSRDSLVINAADDGRLLAAVGLRDMVVVQTDQITVVCPLRDAERIKELVSEVAERLGTRYT